MEGAELVQTGEWRLNDREQGVGNVSSRGRDLEGDSARRRLGPPPATRRMVGLTIT